MLRRAALRPRSRLNIQPRRYLAGISLLQFGDHFARCVKEKSRVTFFLGQEASKSAGVPSAGPPFLHEWKSSSSIVEPVRPVSPHLHLKYPVLVEKVQHYQQLISSVARKPSVGFVALARLLQRVLPASSVVLTTNFDHLLEVAVNAEGGSLNICPDGHVISVDRELLNEKAHTIVKLHGDSRTLAALETPEALFMALNVLGGNLPVAKPVASYIESNLRQHPHALVFVGYAGNDVDVRDFFKEMHARKAIDVSRVYWCNSSAPKKCVLAEWLQDVQATWVRLPHRESFNRFFVHLAESTEVPLSGIDAVPANATKKPVSVSAPQRRRSPPSTKWATAFVRSDSRNQQMVLYARLVEHVCEIVASPFGPRLLHMLDIPISDVLSSGGTPNKVALVSFLRTKEVLTVESVSRVTASLRDLRIGQHIVADFVEYEQRFPSESSPLSITPWLNAGIECDRAVATLHLPKSLFPSEPTDSRNCSELVRISRFRRTRRDKSSHFFGRCASELDIPPDIRVLLNGRPVPDTDVTFDPVEDAIRGRPLLFKWSIGIKIAHLPIGETQTIEMRTRHHGQFLNFKAEEWFACLSFYATKMQDIVIRYPRNAHAIRSSLRFSSYPRADRQHESVCADPDLRLDYAGASRTNVSALRWRVRDVPPNFCNKVTWRYLFAEKK